MNQEKKNIKYAFQIATVFVVIINAIYALEFFDIISFKQFALAPKDLGGLTGIIGLPFLHGSWEHVLNNSFSLFVLTVCLFYFYRELAWSTLIFVVFAGGLWLWIAGVDGSRHVGASGLVYGLAAFLFVSGMIRKNAKLMTISLLVTFMYGSFFWGLLPFEANIANNISWDGHFYGAVAGLVMAIYYRKDGPQRKVYQYEIDEVLEVEEQKRMVELQKILEEQNSNVRIVYHFKKEDKTEDSAND